MAGASSSSCGEHALSAARAQAGVAAARRPANASMASAACQLRVLHWRGEAFGAALLRSEGSADGEADASGAAPAHHGHLLFGGADADALEHEEEVVVWSAAGAVRKRYTAPAPVLQAAWSRFLQDGPSAGGTPWLCLLHAGLLSVYAPSGEAHVVPVAADVRALFATPFGLLLQRGGAGGAAALEALMHPLDETTPVALPAGAALTWTDDALPLALAYEAGSGAASLLCVQLAPPGGDGPAGAQAKRLELLPLWTGALAPPSHVFVCHDADLSPLVCLFSAQQRSLTALRVCRAGGDTTLASAALHFVTPAAAAVPLVASRCAGATPAAPRDLLLLAPDGALSLHVGAAHVCNCQLPPVAAAATPQRAARTPRRTPKHTPARPAATPGSCSDDCDMDLEDAPTPEPPAAHAMRASPLPPTPKPPSGAAGGASAAVTGLCDPCGARATALLADGTALRFTLPLAPLSPVVDAVLCALQAALPADAGAAIARDFFHSASATGDSPDDAWAALCAAVLRWAGVADAAPAPAPAASAWEALLRTDLHAAAAQRAQLRALGALPAAPLLSSSTAGASPAAVAVRDEELRCALDALHAVYEDHKLDMLKWPLLRQLAVLASRVAGLARAPAYVDYYERDWGCSLSGGGGGAGGGAATTTTAPPDVLRCLAALLLTGDAASPSALCLPPLLAAQSACCAWSVTVLRLYAALAAEGPAALPPLCVSLRFGAAQLARLPHGVALPLHEALAAVRPAPPPHWSADEYSLVGRTDLALQCGPPGSAPPPALPHALPLPDGGADAADVATEGPSDDGDGMEELLAFVGPLRFGRDARLTEARRLLCSATAQAVRLSGGADGGDTEQVTALQARLWAMAARTCALPLGRGAFTLATARPLPTEALPVPRLNLAGALPAAHNATMGLDLGAAAAPPDFLVWPEFHNGCAAGLRMAERGQAALTRTWVLYNRPAEPSPSHAGMLLALGLAGHLAALAPGDLYRYLAAEHAPTTAALLLGVAASRRGSGNAAASRLLFLHVPARHPPGFPELELPSLVQAAAVAGVGLLYSGTGHRLMAQVLLTELTASPGGADVQPDGREGHALAAGLALGMVVLGLGRAAPQLADLALETRLARLIADNASQARAAAAAAGSADAQGSGLPLRTGADGMPGAGMVLEGAGVNVGVTGPGATLALGLLFLRTNDAAAAARLAVPDTHFALDFVRPDLLLLRVLARGLILWDGVQGTEDWVDAQLPAIMRDALRPGAAAAANDVSGMPQRRAVDTEALAAAHVNVRAGACLALGLRFAGTAHAGAAAVLRRHVLLFLDLKRRAPAAVGSVDKHTLETCVCSAALALAVVMAGTGNLDTLRLLRRLRARLDPSGAAAITYGSHTAVSMALGFLFLGGGARTFSRAPAATAALLTAIVPPYPAFTGDQRFHLQALRQLYALAAEPRLLRCVDADSGAACYAPIVLRVADAAGGAAAAEHSVAGVAPCLVHDPAATLELRVLGPRHWPQLLRGERLAAALASGTLPVKRRTGCLPYSDDPSGARSLLLRAFHLAAAAVPPPAHGRGGGDEDDAPASVEELQREQLVAAFSGEAHLLSFSERMAGDVPFYRAALHACLASAAGDALPTYLALHAAMAEQRETGSGGGADAPLSLRLSSLKLCRAFYDGALRARVLGSAQPPLLQRTFLDASATLAEQTLEAAALPQLPGYIAGAPCSRLLGAYLAHMGVPPRALLQQGLAAALGAAASVPEPTPLPPCVLRLLVA